MQQRVPQLKVQKLKFLPHHKVCLSFLEPGGVVAALEFFLGLATGLASIEDVTLDAVNFKAVFFLGLAGLTGLPAIGDAATF